MLKQALFHHKKTSMGFLRVTIFFSVLFFLTQVNQCSTNGCRILSATSPSSSSFRVTWEKYPNATIYILDIRRTNSSDSAPIVVLEKGDVTDKVVQGLLPGTEYNVTLKVFRFYYVDCVNTTLARTVPDTPQILEGRPLSSSSITIKWSNVTSGQYYVVQVYSQTTGKMVNFTLFNTSTVVRNLQPSSNYDCYVYAVNQAGFGNRSHVRTITTLVTPPVVINAVQTNAVTARVTWQPVDKVFMYKVTIQNLDEPTSLPFVYNVTNTQLDIGNIRPCTNYLISVSSYNSFLVISEPTTYTYTTNKLTPVSSVNVNYDCTTSLPPCHGWLFLEPTPTWPQLPLKMLYEVHVTPLSGNCKNLVNTSSVFFQTVPCPPNNLTLLRECWSNVIIFSWNHINGANYYQAKAVDSKGIVQNCLTEENSCYFTNTQCGLHYDFTISSFSGSCQSDFSSAVGIRTAPCMPTNLQAFANCSTGILLSTWDNAEGALRYNVTAQGNFQNSLYSCSSQSNSCAMAGLHCGESLTISIKSSDDECDSPRTLGLPADTAPCTPQNVSAVKQCGNDSVLVSWVLSSGSLFYIAMAKDDYGTMHSCNSLDMGCVISGLKCSTKYNVSVIASNFMCNSSESEVVTIETAYCPPVNLTSSLDCAANEALISWQGAPSLNSYTATMTDTADGLLSCSSTKQSCKVSNLKCGQLYTVTVRYHDGKCSGLTSKAIYMDSVPCGPANVTASVDCSSGGVNMTWSSQRNAEGYITMISDSNQQKTVYNTTEPQLSIPSKNCGQEYTVKVMSFNKSCISFPSQVNFKEAPCLPINVKATKNCGQNLVEVTWQASAGAKNYSAAAVDGSGQRLECASNEEPSGATIIRTVLSLWLTASVNCTSNSAKLSWSSSLNAVSYTGIAVSADGHNVSCGTQGLGCQMEGLRCGTTYNFTVSATDGGCQSLDSKSVIQKTAPCPVQSVSNTLNCSTNTLSVSWSPGSMPVNYSATVLSPNGTALNCMTEASSCSVGTLQCGQRYTVTVKAVSSTCESPSSAPTIVNSVPCIPKNIQGVVECSTNTLQASWDVSAGATSYISTVTKSGGFSSSCSSTNASCLFPDLKCAQTYSLNVIALNNWCNSSRSATVSAITAPCDPTNVKASLNCLTDEVTVTWNASAGANAYTVVAEASGHVDSCKSSGTSCSFSALRCGKDYTITVLAGDAKCNSSILAKTNITTAPCPPVLQNNSNFCVTNRTSVNWARDKYAISVKVNAVSNMGHSLSCNSSTDSSCLLDQLRCGNTYTVHAVAQGVQCSSKPSSSFQIVTAPCTPANVGYQYSCDTGIAFVSWDEALGRDSFYVKAHSGDHTASCSSSQGTDCYLLSLRCSHMYDVEVISLAGNCNSSNSGMTRIQTAPCAPTNVSASLLCENNTGEVSWQPSPGAVSYHVKAAGRDGDMKECIVNGSSCLLPNMHCAQTYIITVTPSSNQCIGLDSQPYAYFAGPCPPTNIQASLQCNGNVGHVTWDAALRAEQYIVKTLPSVMDKHTHICSSNGTSCSLTDLHCGETVAITVATKERGCWSNPSTPLFLKTVICPPTGVTSVTRCSNNDITVSWDLSPESGVEYFIHSRNNNSTPANYTTFQTFYTVTGLHCGDLHTFAVAAKNSACSSVFSNMTQSVTAPCAPTNLTVKTECGANLAILRWAPSLYAISYRATFTGTHGHVVSCSTNATTCSVKVDCGHQYSAVVVASTASCNSSSSPLTFNSAPCLPDRVQAELNCTTNSFAVNWRGTVGDVGLYTAIAIGSDGSRVTCNSTSTECTIRNLKCGLLYSLVVTISSVDCTVIEGSDYKIYSAPCKPDQVSVSLQCSTNVALITWKHSGPDQTQVVKATDSRGVTATCNSSSSNCTFNQLSCGETYAISVVGHTNSCSSEPTLAQALQTAPCVPTHVKAIVNCAVNISMVTWDSALGATSYTVYARGSLGHSAKCNSTTTECNFFDLGCGQDYIMTVVALHDTCSSLVSEAINVTTGPCPYTNLKAALDCNANTVNVSWTPGRGILYYVAEAKPFNSIQPQQCSSNGTSCNISSLQCGETYSVSVTGQGENCPSPSNFWYKIITAPCPPTNMRVDSSCASNNITVSWGASQGSVSYMAVAENSKGDQWSCNTSSTTCQIPDLLCGQEYKVFVAGVDQNCFGARSDMKTIHTAPCVPKNIQDHLDCPSGVLNITWQSTGHFLQFHTSLRSQSGHVTGCTTDEPYCVVHDMHCDMTYEVTVQAQDENCHSSLSSVKSVIAAPCPLSSFLPVIDCATGVASITWNTNMTGLVHSVTAVDAAGEMHNCNGTNIGCDLSSLKCGTEYNVTITPSRNKCVGKASSTERIQTVPCVPHLSDVEIDCLANSAWVTFDSSAGAENYIIMASNSFGAVQTFECNSTSDGACALPPLPCSQNLTFILMAQDQQCISSPSNAVTAETAPCPPDNIKESVNCENGTMTISWSAVPGAVTYTATLEEITGGKPSCCTTSKSVCEISGLPCGEMYILHVTAEGRTCNSSESQGLITRTVACVPENLDATLGCSNNVASMSWGFSNGGQLYTVTAVGTDGHVDQCRSPDNKCNLLNLHCGQHYTATVTAEDMECKSKPSENVTIKTVPCTPANVSSVMDCKANALIVSWSESSGADSYIASLRDSNDQTTTCLGTTTGSCNVTGLGCSQIYQASVVSSDGYCNSPPSAVVETPSAPCKPRYIKAMMDCYTRTAEVSWYPSIGALSYEVLAKSVSGSNATCDTNMTTCTLEELLCGQSYSVSVKAIGDSCNSIAEMTGLLVTEPCIPEHITAQYSLTIGQVQWDLASGAENYTVTGETDQGLVVSCATSDTYCALYNMGCGQVYNITVAAHNAVCNDVSVSAVAATIMTEPCPPNDVQTSVDCRTDQGTVSWEASFGAIGYEAKLSGRDGHSLTCHTNDTFCSVESLHCGVIYYTTVIAIGKTLNSSMSTPVLLISAPCTGRNVAANLDCYNSTAEVSWSSGIGATSYIVTAVGTDGFVASCATNEFHCNLTELQCGQVYNVTLTTVSEQCQIELYTNVSFGSRPCEPLRVEANMQCGTKTANLTWEESDGVELYLTTATSRTGTTLHCNSTKPNCHFSGLKCGEIYEFSVTAYSNMCYSDISSTVEIQTEPCQPTGLTLSGSCNDETVMLNWSKAEGAMAYVVTATGNLGYIESLKTNDTMIDVDLPCGQLFTFTVTALDNSGCDGTVSAPKQFKMGPCVPEYVHSFTQCEDRLGSVGWVMGAKADSYLAIAMGEDGHTHQCTTNTTTCTWTDLHCGEVYTINVIALDYKCTSMPSNSTTIKMAPCVPQNLEYSFNCTTKVGSLTWNESKAAEFYIATAETNSGHKIQLSTNETWTFISEFLCGQEYFLSVQAADSVCTSLASPPSKLTSEPCPPTDVSSHMNCISHIAMVSWTGSAGAEFYTTTVKPMDGESKSCWSDSEKCSMPHVPCGQNYTVTVIASNKMCDSDPSAADVLQSVPCVPADVEVKVNCSTNQAVVSWSASDGALSYKVVAESTQNNRTFCETTEQTCTLTNLTCGHPYSVQVVAEGKTCSSLPSQDVEFNPVPCTPKMGSVFLDCYTNSALLDWMYAEGALYYTATAQSSSGHISTCNSNFTNCELQNLQCGQVYNMVTLASNDECNSPPSTSLEVESVPCPPADVVPVLDCSSNTAHVAWQASIGAESYIVQAFGVEEHETGCVTDSEFCVLTDLMCGFTYNISVIAINSVCNVSQSDVEQLQAAPCVPEQVEARVDCESGGVMVSWEPSKGALSYTTIAQGSAGYNSTCSNTETTCLLDDLLCGLNYTITIIASDDVCNSTESSVVEIGTVPCVPQHVTAEMVCSNDTGVVSWEEGEGVTSYKVLAYGPDGHKTECHSSESSCELMNMHCGQLYNLTVTAQDGRCDNSNAFLNLMSVPCKPSNIKATLHCHSNSAAVTWEKASGALTYVAVGVTEDGSHWTECNNTETHCDLRDLQCGKIYNVSVFGQDESCSSMVSDRAYVRTAPCPPKNVVVDAQCAKGEMVVSWSPNTDAQYFHVAAVSNTGARLYCNSSGTACTISNLPCGQHYNVTMLSVRDSCESKTSPVVHTCSAPCVPMKPEGRLDCVSNSVWVSWNPSQGAASYFVHAEAADGHNSNCTTSSSTCSVPDLKCGTQYTFNVIGVNQHCSSNHSTPFQIETGPCALESVKATSGCNDNTILVEWEQTQGTPVYVVTAEADDKTFLSCNTSSVSCVLQDVHCGTNYRIIVSTSSDKCSSLRSPPKKIETVPCAPRNVSVVPLCEINGAAVSWEKSMVATSYQLTATGRDGHVATCNTTVNNCSLNGLHCGQKYSLSITASGATCRSLPSLSSFKTVPCPPVNLTVNIDCQTKSGKLSWNSTEQAVEFISHAASMNGKTLFCSSSSSSCTFENLECGDIYNFTVKSFDGFCNSSSSPTVQAGAVPCPPPYLKVRMQKINKMYWAMISWDRVNCSNVEYLTKITSKIGNNPQALMDVSSYWWERPYFELPMPCSTTFNITVQSKNSAGVSKPSSIYSGITAPCAPQMVQYIGSVQSVVLSWNASVFATNYMVYNVSGGSRAVLCNTTELSCQIANFNPSFTEVTAVNKVGESNPTQNITGLVGGRKRRGLQDDQLSSDLGEVLEVPEVLTVTVSKGSLQVKWRKVKDATEYTVMIEEEQSEEVPGQPPRVETVEGDYYEETGLKASATYCVRVAARNAVNQSSYSWPKCRNTGSSL
ncbi:hypothetical protein OJAV_G00033020 [Oryzias javanicus]|uniref:Fibronectin type-III domain-containing protein n=1 Tax=Oryzias javanicus TaxID=123683 RepID=A0A3S2PR06_ORYJA|nr:hypothetical protein OJAV_G00033020 [Oryzias javanicus]